MLNVNDTALVLVDVQGNLAQRMHQKESLFNNLKTLIKGAQALDIPILWMEQNPKALGGTIPELAELLSGDPIVDHQPISKICFSCAQSDSFMQALKVTGRNQLLITGIEAHICVYQTSVELHQQGYQVEVLADAVSSRNPANKEIGLQKMRDAGVAVTCTETALFELLKVAEGDAFKAILKLVK